MARLETILDGSAEGLETAATRAIGILEGLQKAADKLKIDLFQATTVEDLNSVGVALTAVTGKYNDYVNAALKGNSVWQDQQAAKALDALDAKLRVVNGNAELFGRTMAVDRQEVRAYQSALDSLLKAGLDPTDSRVQSLVGNINRLNAAINAASSGQKNPFTQFENASGIIGNLENRLKNLRQALREATDTRQIVSLNRRIRETGDELARVRGLGDQATGMLGRLEAESKRLRTALTFAQSEKELENLGAEIRKVEGEIARLNNVAGVMNRRFGSDGRQSFNQFGLELGRVIQDLPYASRAFGAASDNFGAIGNNITRMAELFPGYVASLQAAALASGKAATSTNLFRLAIQGLTKGAGAWLLGISLLVSSIQVFTALQARSRREAEKAKKAEEDRLTVLNRYVSTLDSASQAQGKAADGYAAEISRAQLLYNQTQDLTLSTEARRKAVEALKKEFPTYFSGLSDEAILAGNAANEYERLTRNLVASQTARAAEDLTSDAVKERIQLRIRERDNVRQIAAIQERINELNSEITAEQKSHAELARQSLDSEGALMSASQGLLKLTDERNRLLAKQAELGAQSHSDTVRQTQLQSQLNEYQDIFNKATQEALDNLGLFPERTKEAADGVRDYADAISRVFDPSTDGSNLLGLESLDKTQQATRNKYKKLLDEVDRLEIEGLKKREADKTAITQQATDERAEIIKAMDAELEQNRIDFATKSEAKLAELYAKAGISRIKSREQELAADKAYWDGVERNMKEWGITAAQLTELRKASEAGINEKWDAKIAEQTFEYQRRMNESITQTMLRALNERTKLRIAKAKGEEEEVLKIRKEYAEQVAALQMLDRNLGIQTSFNGDAFSVPLAAINAEIEQLKRNFRSLAEEDIAAFQQKISELEVQRQQLQLMQGTVDGISSAFGNLYADAIFNTEDALKNLGQAFENIAKSIISGLIKIAVRYAINQAIGTASLAATTAASSAAAATVASAWATAAALVSAATFGASAAAGGAALAALIASTKALSGFSSGGYTGNAPKNKIAGVVHGQEFVVNASATKDNLPLLKALNAGMDIGGLINPRITSARFAGVADSKVNVDVTVHGEISGEKIKLVSDRANRSYNRYF